MDNFNIIIVVIVVSSPFGNGPLEEIILASDGAIFNNAAQIRNPVFCFSTILFRTRKKEMPARFADIVRRDSGSVELFKETLLGKSVSLFGSGWAWLSIDPGGKLTVMAESNTGNPIKSGLLPILVPDVWDTHNRLPEQACRLPESGLGTYRLD